MSGTMKKKITVKTRKGEMEVESTVISQIYAIHKEIVLDRPRTTEDHNWVIVHVPTGLRFPVGWFTSEVEALHGVEVIKSFFPQNLLTLEDFKIWLSRNFKDREDFYQKWYQEIRKRGIDFLEEGDDQAVGDLNHA